MNCTPCTDHGLTGIKQNTIKEVMADACLILEISFEDVIRKCRTKELALKRQMIMTYLYEKRRFTLQKIADEFKRHYASVIHAKSNINRICEVDREFRDSYKLFVRTLTHKITLTQ